MRDWLALRERLHSRLSYGEWIKIQTDLTTARDMLRRADAHYQVATDPEWRPKSPTRRASELQLDAELEGKMVEPGVAAPILKRMLLAAPRVCRVQPDARLCTDCGLHPIDDDTTITNLRFEELEQYGWCPWTAFEARMLGAPYMRPMDARCDHPRKTLRRIHVANCDADAPADVVVLGLPDASIEQYRSTLRPCDDRTLLHHRATYRMISLIMFTGNAEGGHYITVARDPTARSGWVCYDANANHGVGWEVPPPTGLDTFTPNADKTASAWRNRYWPVAITYVRSTNQQVNDPSRFNPSVTEQCMEEAFVLRCLTRAAKGGDECTFEALFKCMQRQDASIQAWHRARVEDALYRLEVANKVMHREGRVHLI